MIATGLKVRALEASTVSGNVRISGVQIERVEASCVSGNIEFDSPLSKGGRYEFTSHSGDVRIALSGITGFELDADTFSGSVRSDLPITLRTWDATTASAAAGAAPATGPSAAPTATPAPSSKSAATAAR